jgi:hypothetical protein
MWEGCGFQRHGLHKLPFKLGFDTGAPGFANLAVTRLHDRCRTQHDRRAFGRQPCCPGDLRLRCGVIGLVEIALVRHDHFGQRGARIRISVDSHTAVLSRSP